MAAKMRMNLALIALLGSGVASAQSNDSAWQESYALESAKKYAEAAAALSPVLRASPDHEFALTRRAWLTYQQGHYNDALLDYRRVIELNPQSLDARLGMILPLIAQQRWREVAVEAHKVIALSPWDYTAHVRLMLSEEGEHKWDELLQHATELSARYPTDATVLVYLARTEAKKGNKKNARLAYAKVLERMPAHEEATAYLKNTPLADEQKPQENKRQAQAEPQTSRAMPRSHNPSPPAAVANAVPDSPALPVSHNASGSAYPGVIYEPQEALDYCIQSFNDPQYHDWISYRNVCSFVIKVSYSQHGSGAATTMILAPGQSKTTGYTSSEAAHGLRTGICRDGYFPVDAQGLYWNASTATDYRCMKAF